MTFLKISLFTLSFVMLASCTSKNTPESESIPSTEVTTPISSVVGIPVSSTGNSTNTSSVTPVTTSSGNTNSGNIVSKQLSSSTDKLSKDTKSLIDLQKEKGPNALLELNCSKYDAEGKKFCTSQQALIKKFNEETITWEETLKKGPDYIKTFDCMKITNEFGQKYCKEYQVALKLNSNSKK